MKKIKHSTTFSFHREKTDTKTELLLSLTTSSTSKSTFDSSNMSAIPKIGKQLISFILTTIIRFYRSVPLYKIVCLLI